MSLVSKPSALNPTGSSRLSSSSSAAAALPLPATSTEATLSSLLGHFTRSADDSPRPMEKGAPEYSQPGLHTPYPSALSDDRSEQASTDHASAAQYHSHTDPRQQDYAPAPASADHPPSQAHPHPHAQYAHSAAARGPLSSVPDYLQRPYQPASVPLSGSGGMAQSTSPSASLHDDRASLQSPIKSDLDVPIDPSIATSSPAYSGLYSSYQPQPQQEMQYPYPSSKQQYTPYGSMPGMHGMPQGLPPGYAQQRPGEQFPQHTQIAHRPNQVSAVRPRSAITRWLTPGQVYSFVPIPGAQQHKRPRRRFEEIERMYKCGWQGCEKAYGTLNHLNAHVTMQSHGNKRTPEGMLMRRIPPRPDPRNVFII